MVMLFCLRDFVEGEDEDQGLTLRRKTLCEVVFANSAWELHAFLAVNADFVIL